MADELSVEIKQFIDQHIESLAQLEVLLLMRDAPQRLWNSDEISKSLYSPVYIAAPLLADFAKRGFLRVEPSTEMHYGYHVAHEELDRQIAEVASAYQQRRVAVITLIYSKPLNKVKTFADSFRLRKENPP
jgi:hypothetical protein